MNPLLLVLPTHSGDIDNAEALVRWMDELGEYREHSLLVAADNALPVDRVKALGDVARPLFNDVTLLSVPTGVKGWPLAANLAFRAVCRTVQETFKLAFLWCESDAVPLKASWLDDIAEAYRKCPKPFMGALLDNDVALETLPKRYMAGCGIYPRDAYGILTDLWKDPRFTGPTGPKRVIEAQNWERGIGAWDMSGAELIVPRAKHTPLVSHFWGNTYTGSGVPVYRTERTEADPPNVLTLSQIPKEAVLRHRIKDVESFVSMWRIRLEAQGERATAPGGAIPMGVYLPETPPGPDNPNFKGGDEKAKERRRAAAQRSKEYLEEARAKRQQEQQVAMQARAGVTESAGV